MFALWFLWRSLFEFCVLFWPEDSDGNGDMASVGKQDFLLEVEYARYSYSPVYGSLGIPAGRRLVCGFRNGNEAA
jgi:hypothetical protein